MLDDRTLLDHLRMLDDPLRVEPFARAIAATCSGRVVAEIGVGLGPLSLLALRAGARRVYGIEVDARTLAVSTDLMRAHGFGRDRFVPVLGRSEAIDLPEPVDVLIGELIDSVGVGENAGYFLADARRRWLRAGGIVIPGRIVIEVALAASEVLATERRFFSEVMPQRHGLDYGPVLDALGTPRRSITVTPAELRSRSTVWQDIDFDAGQRVATESVVDLEAHRDGRVDGLVFGFRLLLAAGVEIDTRPGTPPTCWEQGFLPLPFPIDVRAGETYQVQLSCPRTREPWAPVRAVLDRLTPAISGETSN